MVRKYTSKNRRKFSMKVHIILVTKYRRPWLSGIMEACVKDKITKLCAKHNWEIVAMETDWDHVHILLSYDATERVSDIIHYLKQKTSWERWKISTIFYILGIGRNMYFGRMVTFLVVLEKYLKQLSRDT